MSPDSSVNSLSSTNLIDKPIGHTTSVIRLQVGDSSQTKKVSISPIFRGTQLTTSSSSLPQNSVIFLNKSVSSYLASNDVNQIRQSQDIRLQTLNLPPPPPPPSLPKITTESSSSVYQQQQQQHRSQTPEYTKSIYPVMDTTVASSITGEPELNIGMDLI